MALERRVGRAGQPVVDVVLHQVDVLEEDDGVVGGGREAGGELPRGNRLV